MELTEAMRTTGTCRYFRPDPVPDEVLRTAFDAARFGPQGGNRQPVRWIVVRDAATKQALADLYLPPWKAYFGAHRHRRGQRRRAAPSGAGRRRLRRALRRACPVLVVVCAELAGLHPTDTELGRLSDRRRRVDLPHRAELLPRPARPGRRHRVHDPALHERAAGARAAGDPGRLRHRRATSRSATRARPFPTKLTRSPVEEIVFAETFGTPLFPPAAGSRWPRQTPLGRATIGDQLRRHARTQPRQGRLRDLHARPAPSSPTPSSTRWPTGGRTCSPAHGVGRGHVVAMLARNGIPTGGRLLRRAQARRGVHRGQPDVPGARGGVAARARRADRRARRPGVRRRSCDGALLLGARRSTPSWPRTPTPSRTPRSTRTTSRCSSTPRAPPRRPRAC